MKNNYTPVMFDGVAFDAMITHERRLDAEIPDYPIETGFSVQDTIILKPMYLEMTLLLSNTPLTSASSEGRIEQISDRLIAVYEKKNTVSVVTSKGYYENMGVESISLKYSVENKSALEVALTMKQVRETETKTTTIPAEYGKGGESGADAGTASSSGGSSSSSGGGSATAAGSSSQNSASQKAHSTLFGLLGGGRN